MFGNCDIKQDLFTDKLKSFGNVIVTQSTKSILITEVNGIKVDFVNYKYPLISDSLQIDNIRMLSAIDIAAMKLNAIAGRGSKKDFIDLFYLLEKFSLKQMIDFYNQKYSDGSEFMILKSLSYFEDANDQINPKMLNNSFNWETCKQKITEELIKIQ